MSPSVDTLERQYSAALEIHLAGSSEEVLHAAYVLGRMAAADGMGVVDIAILHHETLLRMIAANSAGPAAAMVSKAVQFLVECLSPYEMLLSGYRASNTSLVESNEQLREAKAALERAIVDINERRRVEQEMEQQRRDLERSNADLTEFAYIASHDLKAPLRAIALLAQWIREDVEPVASPEAVQNLELLQGRVARLQMLLDGLMAYSRARRSQSAIEELDIAALVLDIVAMLAPPPGFSVVWEGEPSVLRTHRVAIQVVLENLISNALKHRDRDEGCITVSMRLMDGEAEFRVSDDGPGIPPQFHDRIFLIFQTLLSRDEMESSGVGLAIVKKKVEEYGGRIRVESAPPARGTAFVFTWKEAAR